MAGLFIVFTHGTSCFLPPSAGIAVGFYGNGESSDGASRVVYSLRHANHTISGVEKLVSSLLISFSQPSERCVCVCLMALRNLPQVSDSSLALNQTVEENLVQLESAFKEQTDYVSIVQKLQGQLDELVRLMVDLPFWSNTGVSLEELAHRTEAFDFYRWVVLRVAVQRCLQAKSNYGTFPGGWATSACCCSTCSSASWFCSG